MKSLNLGKQPWITILTINVLAFALVLDHFGGAPKSFGGGGTIATLHPAEGSYFFENAQEVGIDFVHFNGMSGELFLPEITGSGAALFDCDNDERLDLLFIQGNILGPRKTLADMKFHPKGSLSLGRLYHNDLTVRDDGSRTLRFSDVTERSGIKAQNYGMGVATGDYDNDGWVDLYVTGFGGDRMLRNKGNCTFEDMTEKTGTNTQGWSVSAAFLDFDRDGWLDLFVGSYVDFRFTNPKECFFGHGAKDYCGPLAFQPLPNRLFHNRGDGTFEDVTAQSQINRSYNGALGVACADFDGDGWPDIYVANDGRPNELWVNQRNGTFKNEAMLAGCALDDNGHARDGMGVDAGDFDNNGTEDLVITNLKGEGTMLYVNNGKGWFEDRSVRSGLGISGLPFTGFGTAFFDFDNDGWLDVLTANGEVRLIEDQVRAKDPRPLKQRLQLFHNLTNGRFEDVSIAAGSIFQVPEVGRGAAFGDVDNDGDVDVVIVNNAGPAWLLVNKIGRSRHWIGLKIVGSKAARDMLGARAEILRPDGSKLWRRVRTDGSYASANDPRVLVGLGASSEVEKVRIYWPNGKAEEWTGLSVDRYVTLREDTGKRLAKQ
jgi:enediyne biosynthesis protein E4